MKEEIILELSKSRFFQNDIRRDEEIHFCPDDGEVLYITYDENGHRVYTCPICSFIMEI